jgi:hypothetical protein
MGVGTFKKYPPQHPLGVIVEFILKNTPSMCPLHNL